MFNQNRWANNCTTTPLFYIYCCSALIIMKTEQQIRDKIKEIRNIQEGLRLQGRIEEAKHWNETLYYLHWVLGERD